MLTALPAVGQVVTEGESLYALNGTPVVLLYGLTPAWRTLSEGATGPDVAELNADLVALGDATSSALDASSDVFSAATASAVEHLQAALGAPQTGSLAFGQAVFLPTAARIITVPATLGSTARPGAPILTATSPTRQVTAELDATQQSEVRAGDPVTITLPDNTTTTGVVASVGRVATAQSGNGPGTSAPPTLQVVITPTDPAATGAADQAPATVTVTTSTVRGVLAVPVDALSATSTGQPALDVVDTSSGATRPLPVTLGLVDDAEGLVQVSGAGLAPGDTVARPDQSSVP